MSSNEYLIDVFNRHSVYINRLGASEYKRVEKFIDKALSDTRAKLADITTTEYQSARYYDLIRGLETQLDQIFREMNDEWTINLERFAIYEADFTAKALEGAVAGNISIAVPNTDVIKQSALNKRIRMKSKQHDIRSLMKDYTKKKQNQILSDIAQGVSLGETIEQLNTRLTGVGVKSKNQAKALSRTVTNHIMTEARTQTFRENSDIMDGLRVIATLDSKTTLICASKDQDIIGFGDPTPPYHIGCRSTVVPSISAEYNKAIEGYRPAKGSAGKDKVGAYTDYGSWLKRQSAEFQKDVLGPTKYELFRDGQFTMKDFVDSSDNVLSLEQLMQKQQLELSF